MNELIKNLKNSNLILNQKFYKTKVNEIDF